MAKTASRLDEIDQQTLRLAQSIEQSILEIAAQIVPLNERYRRLTGQDFARFDVTGSSSKSTRGSARGDNGGSQANEGGKKSGGKKRRIRRNAEQLKKSADEIVAFIKKAGPEGVKGSAIRAEFGTILPSIKEFVKQYGGKALKTKGEKAGMTYHHSD